MADINQVDVDISVCNLTKLSVLEHCHCTKNEVLH